MERRSFISTALGTAGFSTVGTSTVLARKNGDRSGKGSSSTDSNLVNAERTDDGAIVATDDEFVISGQEIEVDGQDFYSGDKGAYVIYNDGYSGEISDNEITVLNMATDPTYGIRVEGGTFDIASNDINGNAALAERFLSVSIAGGAAGKFAPRR